MITKTVHVSLLALLLAAFAWGCGGDDSSSGGGDVDTEADSDTDTDTNTDTDTDGDTDGGCDTDTDSLLPSSLTECDGGKLDPVTDLCWQDPSGGLMNWYRASGSFQDIYNHQNVDYCGDLVQGGAEGWRLPDMDELISLVRGCVNGAYTGDLSTSICEMTPAGCAAVDTCEGKSDCNACLLNSGPGACGCFWDPALDGTCGGYWSSSSRAGHPAFAWLVFFNYGYVGTSDKILFREVRCVRDE